ncbi:MAG: hypothetical protein V2A66_03055 [Pseudomonadota bacterium]
MASPANTPISPQQPTKGVFFIIDTSADDNLGAANPHRVMYRRGDIEKSMPESEIVVISTTANRHLNRTLALEMRLRNNPPVDGFYLLSHGGGGLNKWFSGGAWKDYYSGVSNESGSFRVWLDDTYSVERVFGPILRHFSNKVRVIIDGCNTIDGGSEELKMRRMENIADNFGLTEGALFMLNMEGRNLVDIVFRTPFYEQKSFLTKARSLILQTFWPVSLPLSYGLDFLRNRGYTLRRLPDRDELYKDRLQTAKTSPKLTGELVLTSLRHPVQKTSVSSNP